MGRDDDLFLVLQAPCDGGQKISHRFAGAGPGLDRRDAVPLFINCTIDFLIFLLTLGKRWTRLTGLSQELRATPETRDIALHAVLESLENDGQSVVKALRPYLYYERGKPMIAVPVSMDETSAPIRVFMDLLRTAGDVIYVYRPSFMVRYFLNQIESPHAGAKAFMVFRPKKGVIAGLIKQSVYEDLDKAHRPAEAATIPGSENADATPDAPSVPPKTLSPHIVSIN